MSGNEGAKILVVEDEENIRYSLQKGLTREGFLVCSTERGVKALELASEHEFDLILLDLLLPDISGLDVCRLMRKESDVPIIMVTARDAEHDVIVGLEMGADDYITKPFSMSVLVARVRACLRRRQRTEREGARQLQVGSLSLDERSYSAEVDGSSIDLTPRLFRLLFYLAEREGEVCSRDHILDEIWGYDYFGETRTLDVHIHWLRDRLKGSGTQVQIETVRGIGYRLVDS